MLLILKPCAVSEWHSTIDKVFDQKDSTQKVYDDIVKRIITSSMGGFNGTIFAYGQTSSGKTHTMHGNESEPGIIKLAVKNMFSIVENDKTREYLIRVSFLEIYNEVLRDLLEPSKTNLKIHENAKREIFVGDLSEHIVFNATQVEEILAKGDRNRHIAGTNMNERSSRSHTIFRIVIESREKAEASSGVANESESASLAKRQQRLSTGSFADSGEFTGAVMVSCLNLVDLAGSERVGQTGAEGQRLKEGAHINRSLLSLGTVIARLSEDGGDRGHIPYRDSKITRILQPSLGGNAKTLIICTITPAPDYVDEAVSTLKFASRAKTIQNKPEVNEELRGDALLRRLKRASE
ncbi:kinesin-domain-containing protein, partial [Martensiomyces pterosporus]